MVSPESGVVSQKPIMKSQSVADGPVRGKSGLAAEPINDDGT